MCKVRKYSYQSAVFCLCSSFFCSDGNKSTLFSQSRVKTWTCAQPSYGSKPNLDVCTVRAVIQLSLAKNKAEQIYSCFHSKLTSDRFQVTIRTPMVDHWQSELYVALTPGGYFQIRRSGGLDLTSSLETKFGARSGQVHKIRGKIWEVLSPKEAKVGKKPQFWGHI